jgi:cell division protein FtsW
MKKNPEYALIIVGVALLALGILMVYSASAVAMKIHHPREVLEGKWNFFLHRQLVALSLGIALSSLLFIFKKVDLFKLGKYAWVGIWMALILLVIVLLLPGDSLGAKRFISIGKFQFQPAEFAKLAMVFYLAYHLAAHAEKVSAKGVFKLLRVIWQPLIAVVAMAFLIEKEPALGSSIVIFVTFIFMLFIAGIRKKYLLNTVLLSFLGVAFLIKRRAYRFNRVKEWWDSIFKGKDIYQILQGKLGIGAGHWIGVGLGQGKQKYFVPEVHTDFIFAVIGEEFGLLGTFVVLGLFLLVLYLGFKIALNCKNTFLALLASGLTFMLVFQAYFNIGVVIGGFPCTGVTLPFISYGGTSLVVSIFALATLVKISLYDVRENLKEADTPILRGKEG